MSADERIVERLRETTQTVLVRPSGNLWMGMQARVRHERRRRVARRVAPAVALATAAVGAVVGLTTTRDVGDMSVVPADVPSPRTSTIRISVQTSFLHPVSFTAAETAAIPLECAQSAPGRADPARATTFGLGLSAAGLEVLAAVRDETGVSVTLAKENARADCEIPLDASGRPDILTAYGYSWNSLNSTRPAPTPIVVDIAGVHGFGWANRPDETRSVHVTGGRVSAQVARVTATTAAGSVLDVPIKDGYFLVRVVQVDPPSQGGSSGTLAYLGPGAAPPDGHSSPGPGGASQSRSGTPPLIRAYDRDGRLLATIRGA